MSILQYEVPIRFPPGWERTPPHAVRVNTQFSPNITISDALRYLEEELSTLGVRQASLHTNYNGLKKGDVNSKRGSSDGASLSFSKAGREVFLACDCWSSIVHNVYVLHLVLRNLRMIEEWGAASMEYLLQPFFVDKRKEYASTHADITDWMTILGLGPTATLEDANAVYRQRAKATGGEEDKLRALNDAITHARNALGG